jgi:SAM-dependent methyltransferase
MYLTGKSRWDTGITPPEIRSLVEDEQVEAGRALDLGCGTGTTSNYLATHGWQATGVDFVPTAIRKARIKARRNGVSDRTKFVVGDVTRLRDLGVSGPFDLAIDIGCSHSLPADQMDRYAKQLADLVRPGGIFMLYMFRPTPDDTRGLDPEDVQALYAPAFDLTWSDLGTDTAASRRSAWYRLTRNDQT